MNRSPKGRGRLKPFLVLIATYTMIGTLSLAAPPLINYRANLTDSLGNPVPDSTYLVHFRVYRVETGGVPVWSEDHDVTTKNGTFRVKLGMDAGLPDSVFADTLSWLGIAVDPDPEMEPRSLIGSVPWAINAGLAERVKDKSIGKEQIKDKAVGKGQLADKAVGKDQLDSAAVDTDKINGKAVGKAQLKDKAVGKDQLDSLAVTKDKINNGAVGFKKLAQEGALPGQVVKWSGSQWIVGNDSVVTGDSDNDWVLTGNVLETAGGWGVARAGNTLYGNDDSTHVNLGVTSTTGTSGQDYEFITVSGGHDNTAAGSKSTVGGGEENVALSDHATVGGGHNNSADGSYSTIGGGQQNETQNDFATVCGGQGNDASGSYAMVPGGRNNVAGGSNSFAAGNSAVAAHGGVFVWNDNAGGPFSSTTPNQFLISAAAGVGINTNSPNADLDVNGDINASNKITVAGIDVGGHSHSTPFSESFVLEGAASATNINLGPGVQAAAATNDLVMVATDQGVITRMYVYVGTADPVNAFTVTARVNGIDTALQITVPATGSTGSDTDSVAFDAGDRIHVHIAGGASVTATNVSVTLQIEYTTGGPQ